MGLGIMRVSLATGYVIRCYTYVDRDATIRRFVWEVLQQIMPQHPSQLPDSAMCSFDKRIPQAVSLVRNFSLMIFPYDINVWICYAQGRRAEATAVPDGNKAPWSQDFNNSTTWYGFSASVSKSGLHPSSTYW